MAATKAQKQKFISLRAEGNSFDEIAKKINISKPTLIKWNKEFHEEIIELHKIMDEKFIEEEKLKRKIRAKYLRNELEKAYEALEKTNYDKLSKKEIIHLIDKLESKFTELSKIDDPADDDKEWKVTIDYGTLGDKKGEPK
ncbi:MAG: helix-turn-helix domain-containing protein [Melioribacteraceae bacterium]|jgi:transposase|nr:MAG: helix-turn-helix domain-containing protein [Melioribacteraceae bacterium]